MAAATHSGWISIWVGRRKRYSRWREVCQERSAQDAHDFLEWKYGQTATRTLVLPIAETPHLPAEAK